MLGAILMFIFAHSLSRYTSKMSSDLGTFFEKERNVGIHTPVIFNIRLIALTTFLFSFHTSPITSLSLILVTQVGYIFFVILGRPHLKRYDLFRSLCLECGLLFILIMRICEIYILQDAESASSDWFPALASIEYLIYLVGIVVSLISLAYHCLEG